MTYSGVYVFGDSLVDAGNALKLAQWYGNLTFSDLPDGAPTARFPSYADRSRARSDRSVMERAPRPIAIVPDWTSSLIP